MRIFYVYLHRRKSDGSVFYVGKGKGNRSTSLSGRHAHWKNTATKHGWTHEIVKGDMPEPCAFTLEKILIASHHGRLVNKSTGGEGMSGVKHTDETKAKYRAAKLGKKQSPDHAMKSASAKIGKKQPRHAVEITRMARSRPVISSDGVVHRSATEAARTMSEKLGVNCSQGNISMCARGERNNAYGLSWSHDTSAAPDFIPTTHQVKEIACVQTGETFPSVQAARKWVASIRGSANSQCISYAARTGRIAYGYNWKYNRPADVDPSQQQREVA